MRNVTKIIKDNKAVKRRTKIQGNILVVKENHAK